MFRRDNRRTQKIPSGASPPPNIVDGEYSDVSDTRDLSQELAQFQQGAAHVAVVPGAEAPHRNGFNAMPAWTRQNSNAGANAGASFAVADRSARIEANAKAGGGQSPYDRVLESVKNDLQTGKLLSPAAYDNPTDEDYKIVMDVARKAIVAYNTMAPTSGLPLLIEGDESSGETTAVLERTAKRMTDDVLGWGPIAPYMADPNIEEIMINGHQGIFIQRAGQPIEEVSSQFRSEYALRLFINNKLDYGAGGRGVTVKTPWRDHRLRDGSRVHVIMDPLVTNLGTGGIAVTIRRFRSVARTLSDLVRLGTLTEQAARFLAACIQANLNICISGGTGTGKTTFLTALTSEINVQERVVTVEDTPELQLGHLPNWIALGTRERSEGADAVSMADNVRHCLRMRPKRILLGEARGAEMIAILEAMNTGHDGCMFTVHADDAYRTLQRIETLYLKGGLGNVPMLAIRREVASAINLIINIGMFRLRDGREIRRVKEIDFVTSGIEGDLITHEPIFHWEHDAGREESSGRLVFTHAAPRPLIRRLEERSQGFSWVEDVERGE